ncbi:hypothetical protein DB43_FB00080 [Parachlamydia acanthamoebae]|uniref:Uncharacterized protein n=1 Tax=Parachlamydia acanthamoebae TaxID=83552 RepID=A0A0C1CAP6_9BACT|nr:hypothetical protein DB43_FB00080 [Parachlamydia acanthamoebae]
MQTFTIVMVHAFYHHYFKSLKRVIILIIFKGILYRKELNFLKKRAGDCLKAQTTSLRLLHSCPDLVRTVSFYEVPGLKRNRLKVKG